MGRFLLLLLLALPVTARANGPGGLPSPSALCRAAIAAAEREYGLPAGLLAAIGRVESGRRDPATGETGPWPWTMNAEGRGKFFPGKAEAVAEVRQLRAGGMRLIDVGCMQINLHHHPNAFASLEEAFDPLANARYAARFLKELQSTRNDWMQAAANYHSNTPERAAAYRAAVAAALPQAQREAGSAPAWNPAWRAPAVMAAPAFAGSPFGGSRSNGGGMVATVTRSLPAGEGGRGRGLEAYRSLPIPLAVRAPVRGAPG
ncbi:transglycosylase SLT domain-containing protein [Roseomonas sp. OT10]|uniref:transglycosylase SLT domain-containing protein n=1 Tax=Roseomonas cutis TaxID=2897332 RepID=UPI001E5D5EC0|nr:transglycosylase SLT domain-containing protein [Roseomonas sp. OT10]UFN48194.1 transglycosylase SLT domain-containing protein [Roseomonas sp. OT10]